MHAMPVRKCVWERGATVLSKQVSMGSGDFLAILLRRGILSDFEKKSVSKILLTKYVGSGAR